MPASHDPDTGQMQSAVHAEPSAHVALHLLSAASHVDFAAGQEQPASQLSPHSGLQTPWPSHLWVSSGQMHAVVHLEPTSHSGCARGGKLAR